MYMCKRRKMGVKESVFPVCIGERPYTYNRLRAQYLREKLRFLYVSVKMG